MDVEKNLGYPKPKRLKLSPSEYHQLRIDLYNEAREHCQCGRWMAFNESHLHHIKSRGSGGSDDPSNLILICWRCHRKIHDGNL